MTTETTEQLMRDVLSRLDAFDDRHDERPSPPYEDITPLIERINALDGCDDPAYSQLVADFRVLHERLTLDQ